MSKRQAIIIPAIVVAVLIGVILAYQQWWSPQAKVRILVDHTARAFADKDPQKVLEAITPDFEQDGMTKEKLGAALVIFYAEFDKAKVTMSDQKISMTGDQAVDSIKVVVVVSRGGEQGYLLGQFGNPAALAVKLKRRSRWLITGVDGLPRY